MIIKIDPSLKSNFTQEKNNVEVESNKLGKDEQATRETQKDEFEDECEDDQEVELYGPPVDMQKEVAKLEFILHQMSNNWKSS